MFNNNKHGFFCRCESCKYKRMHNSWYLLALSAITILIFYQSIVLMFLTSKGNAIFLFILLVILTIGIARMVV